jgi:hypothetical protein
MAESGRAKREQGGRKAEAWGRLPIVSRGSLARAAAGATRRAAWRDRSGLAYLAHAKRRGGARWADLFLRGLAYLALVALIFLTSCSAMGTAGLGPFWPPAALEADR